MNVLIAPIRYFFQPKRDGYFPYFSTNMNVVVLIRSNSVRYSLEYRYFSYFSTKSYISPASVALLDTHSTSDQEVAGLTPAGLATFFHGDLIMKYFLRSFSPFR